MNGKTLARLCHQARTRNRPLLARLGKLVELPWAKAPRPRPGFGLVGDAVAARDAAPQPASTLLVAFQPERLGWIPRETVRLFRFGAEPKAFEKVAEARLHRKHSVVYARITKAGSYGLIGLHAHPLV